MYAMYDHTLGLAHVPIINIRVSASLILDSSLLASYMYFCMHTSTYLGVLHMCKSSMIIFNYI